MRSAISLVLLALVSLPACQGDEPASIDDHGPVLSRAVAEPPGPNCAEGGTAVQSGIDADEDGSLGDDEVEATVYVCRRDRVRLVAEPAGANCAEGGTAIWVGDDADGDDVLDESEVRDVAYLCDAALALLTRVELDAWNAPCEGGAAIHVGHDLDGDGELDDGEVLVTEYVCTGGLAGYVVIDSPADVEYYKDVRVATGDVVINSGVTDVELPELWFVGGRVWAVDATQLETLSLPSLYEATNGVALSRNPALATAAMPNLSRLGGLVLIENGALAQFDADFAVITGGVTIRNNPILAELDWVDVYLGGQVEISGNPALQAVTIESQYRTSNLWVRDNAQLASISITSEDVGGWMSITDNASLTLLAFQVGIVHDDLRITNNPLLTTLDAYGIFGSGLYQVVDDLVITGSPIETFHVGSDGDGLYVMGDAELADLEVATLREDQAGIEYVGGTLTVRANPGLELLRLRTKGSVRLYGNPALEFALVWYEQEPYAPEVHVMDNPVLEDFHAVWLRAVGDQVVISNNPALRWPGLDSLQSASTISITGNGALPVCMIEALFARVNAYTESQSGNDADGVCE